MRTGTRSSSCSERSAGIQRKRMLLDAWPHRLGHALDRPPALVRRGPEAQLALVEGRSAMASCVVWPGATAIAFEGFPQGRNISS
jgi:hypothetical protein